MNDNFPLIKKCHIKNFSIEYLHYPSGGPDLLMLHATGFLPWLWHPIARALSDSYNIIVPYYCENRNAEPEDGGVLWSILADDLSQFCASLNIKNPFAVGHSMGGTVLTLCTALHNLNPKSMILIEPIFLPSPAYTTKIAVEQHPLASKSINRRNEWSSIDEAYSYFKNKKLFSRWDAEMLDLYIKYGMLDENGKLKLQCHPRKEAALFMGVNAIEPWPLLPKIECPILIVEGGLSENKAFIDYKKTANFFPHGSYREFGEAGHLLPMEKPLETAELMKNFFQGNLQQ